ncbi:MAG: DUF58 domain-containing protein [Gammaproteobacteria bacterium]|nr:DUF58 domain-containing protein [Gammaproteobacteria bacterium]
MPATSTAKRFNFRRFFVGEGPQAPPYYLNHRRVYILPTRQGLVFALLLLAMLLGSINYNNNLGYILTFLLASLAVVTIFMTYRNMLYLRIGPAMTAPVFAGKLSTIPVQIDNQQYSTRFAIEYHLPKARPVARDIPANAGSTLQLEIDFAQRGFQPLPRFIVATTFPLGLFRAWSHVELQQSVLIYPQPGNDKILPQLSAGEKEGERYQGGGNDDFEGLRNYQVGDSFYRIHWKSAARHHVLQTKQYVGSANSEVWIDWEDSRFTDIEKRISQLTQWVMLAANLGIPYGFRIPGVEYSLSAGVLHRNNCLKALALYGANDI